MEESNPRVIQSAEVVFDIFEVIRANEGVTLTELAEQLDKAPSTVHQYLTTLKRREFVVQDQGVYQLSYRFLDFGTYERQRNPLFEIAKKKTSYLAAETGERAQFSVAEHGRVVVLYTEAGDQAIHAGLRAGRRILMHASAAGKAILAHSLPERVDAIVARHGLAPITENTLTTREELTAELESIRAEGVAYNDREDTPGLRAVGTPILDSDGRPLGALSISGPGHRLDNPERDSEIRSILRGSANELELRIGYE